MGKCIISLGGGGGMDPDEFTALPENVLQNKIAGCNGYDDPVTGTMPNNGSVTQNLNCGNSYTIPEGYHDGSGTVTANSLASQTGVDSGKTAAGAAHILTGYQAWVNGVKVSGSMSNQGAVSKALNCGGSYTIPAGYHNGSGKVTANSLSSQTSANAAAADILSGKNAWVNGTKINGSMGTMAGGTYTPSTSAQTISCSGKKMTGNIVFNAIPSNYLNITNGQSVFLNGAFGAIVNQGWASPYYYGGSSTGIIAANGAPEIKKSDSSETKNRLWFENTSNRDIIGCLLKGSIDMTRFKKLTTTWYIGFTSSTPTTIYISIVGTDKKTLKKQVYKSSASQSKTNVIVDVDLSDVTGHCYIVFDTRYYGAGMSKVSLDTATLTV